MKFEGMKKVQRKHENEGDNNESLCKCKIPDALLVQGEFLIRCSKNIQTVVKSRREISPTNAITARVASTPMLSST